MCHKSENWEDNDCREEWGEGVDAADNNRVPINVVVEFVIRSKCQECSDSNSIWEKDLSATINPALACLQDFPIWCEQEFKSFKRSRKCQCFDAKDAQQYVRRDGWYPNDLKKLVLE